MGLFQRGAAGHRRFPALILGGVLASVVWLVALMAGVTSPQEAKERRTAPRLPVPTAALEERVLQQVAWHDCAPVATVVTVTAPPVPAGLRAVVTSTARPGAKADTGVVLARVAGQPVIAVATDAVLYRDLAVGDRGADARGVEEALARAGLIGSADGVIDTTTVAAWHRLDPAGPSGRLRLSTMVAVPARARVAAVLLAPGDPAASGAELLQVSAPDRDYECPLDGPATGITSATSRLEVGGDVVPIDSLRIRDDDDGGPPVVVVRPTQAAKVAGAAEARLGTGYTKDDGPVLAAPLSAIKVDADGAPSVVLVDGKRRRPVAVRLGVTAQGLVAVTGKGLARGAEVQLFEHASVGP